MAQGKYFVLRSRLNGLVADISGCCGDPGAAVTTWEAKEPGTNENQLWYEHHGTGTIRSKLNDFCLDLEDNHFVVNPHSPGKDNQRWMLAGDRVQHRDNSALVMDISGKNTDPGAELVAWEAHGEENQQWEADYDAPRYFFIHSVMNDKVLDVRGGSSDPGTDVIMYSCHDDASQNQMWYENKDGCICSKLNDYALDSSSGHLKLEPYDPSNHNQQWVVNGDRIQNKYNPNQVLDISGSNADDEAELCAYEFHGNDNQLWKIRFL